MISLRFELTGQRATPTMVPAVSRLSKDSVRFLVHHFEFNRRYTPTSHAEHFSSAARDVNDTSAREWATIIDAHYD